MKLIFAIVNDEDELDVMRGLSQEGYGVTKLSPAAPRPSGPRGP